MKKRLFFFAITILATVALSAQVPQTFTYQAVVRDSQGRLVSNSVVGVQLSILHGSPNGEAVYTDRQQVSTNANGLITLLVGSAQNPIRGIEWADGPYYLKSEVDPNGGSNYSISTTQQLLSVPYALHAHMVDSIGQAQYEEHDPIFTAWNKDYYDLINRPTLFSGNYNDLTNKPTLFSGSYIDLTDKPTLFSGNYNDLTNRPTLFSGSYNDLTDKPTLFSGNYNDLTNRPTIPTVPSNVSAFVNDAGYITTCSESQTLANVVALGNTAGAQLKGVSDPTDSLDAVNLRSLNVALANMVHRYDSIIAQLQNTINSLNGGGSPVNPPQPSCTTYGDTTATAEGSFIWYGINYTVSGNYTHTFTNAAGCDSIVTLHLTITALVVGAFTADGATYSTFSVSPGHQVNFSRGNLQYNPMQGSHDVLDGDTAQGTWRFAPNQYATAAAGAISSTFNGWFDLFGWGTTGFYTSYGNWGTTWAPWTTSTGSSSYPPTSSPSAYTDWATFNAISNGGNVPNMWRTPTYAEWNYLFNTRYTSNVGGTVNARYAFAVVAGAPGVIVFPDEYTHPSGVQVPTSINTPCAYDSNIYTISHWNLMETAGCVFLPAAGFRRGTVVYYMGEEGDYWSVTNSGNAYSSNTARYIYFGVGVSSAPYLGTDGGTGGESGNTYIGMSVRPIRDCQ